MFLVKEPLAAINSFIGAWHINDQTLCDDIIAYFEYEKKKSVKDGGLIYNNVDNESQDLLLNPSILVINRYSHHIDAVLSHYTKQYAFSDNTDPFMVEAAILQKYNPGNGVAEWHNGRGKAEFPKVARHLTFMTFLNNVNEGGEIEFYHQKLKVKPKKGLTLIWPSDWTHTHRELSCMSEYKYVIMGWYILYSRLEES